MPKENVVLDVFLGGDHGKWRLYVAEASWIPDLLRRHVNHDFEAFPVVAPDFADLHSYMRRCEAHYKCKLATLGGGQIVAYGRHSALALARWLVRRIGETASFAEPF